MLRALDQEIASVHESIPLFWRRNDEEEQAQIARARLDLRELHARYAAVMRELAELEEAHPAPASGSQRSGKITGLARLKSGSSER